ncbi:MAG: signal peptidase I [Nocardioidaceae bacterium]|nr:signal peptidase I [Nocardioidaceae bacterium]
MSTLRSVARYAGNALLVVVLLGSAAFLAPSLLGYERYVIVSGSMTGTYDIGSIVFDKTVPVGELAAGDVITYQPPADSGVPNLVTHRIVSVRHRDGRTVYRTKGDDNPTADPWVFSLQSPVQPKVAFSVPYVGRLFLALADRQTRIVVIGVPAGLIALASLVELAKALRPRRAPADTPDVSTATTSTPVASS